MRTERRKKRLTGSLAVLAVFSVFAFCVPAVVLYGARVYRDLTALSAENAETRTAALYLSGKIRQAARSDAVTVCRFGDGDCLLIPETHDGARYQTRVYCHDGWLTELYGEAESRYAPEEGEKLCRASSLEAAAGRDGLRLALRLESGETVRLCFARRGGSA